ncbi:MAG: ABC transporter ATP-binding protein [Phycisphaerae bacterium]|jgi:ABC-type lipoprotein export system ATPase subunit|nr:ABC transporter ATP-binding protein [Phycisphaerae bacterium]MDP7288299.1 ABC transporter ATP-binding protein [Phycisphaerae bacterium]
MNDQKLLELTDVCKTYQQARDDQVAVLSNISLTVKSGQAIAIVGPSGSGKSTLLNLIGALDRPTSGTVRLDGRDLTSLKTKQLAELRRDRIGFVFQQHHLLPQCTVLENVLLPALASGSVTADLSQRAIDLLKRVALADRADDRPTVLSGGERQRVALARALINSPSLLLADEPTGSLDRQTSESLIELLVELNRSEGTTLIVVTHSSDLAGRMDRVLELRDGALNRLETSR